MAIEEWCGKECAECKGCSIVKSALEKQIPYKLKNQDGDTGICICGTVTEIIDEPFYCRYCGQKLCK